MSRFIGTPEPPHGQPPRVGILLVNLGTPAAPNPRALRRYLGQFLADPRIVELPRWLWRPVLHGIILRFRPARSAALYRSIWGEQGSPLETGMAALAENLQAWLGQRRAAPILVRHAMRYGEPAIGRVMREMAAEGVRRLLVLPLFPQYSGTTTGSAMDAVGRELARWRWVPDLRFVADYHADPRYIEALARSVESHWAQHGRGQKLLLSYHGIPEKYLHAGDPYFCQCHATGRLLRERLGLAEDELIVAFQSRFGRGKWLGPHTEDLVEQLPAEGVRRLQVLCPGFSVDCLETLEEIAIRNHASFLHAGGERLDYIPCLNAGPDHVSALGELVLRQGGGWPELEADFDPARAQARAQAARQRAARLQDAR